jgi:hypothetical protein
MRRIEYFRRREEAPCRVAGELLNRWSQPARLLLQGRLKHYQRASADACQWSGWCLTPVPAPGKTASTARLKKRMVEAVRSGLGLGSDRHNARRWFPFHG